MSDDAPADPPAPYYDDLLKRARLLGIVRRSQRREASRRLQTAMGTMRSQAIDLSAVEQTRRGRG